MGQLDWDIPFEDLIPRPTDLTSVCKLFQFHSNRNVGYDLDWCHDLLLFDPGVPFAFDNLFLDQDYGFENDEDNDRKSGSTYLLVAGSPAELKEAPGTDAFERIEFSGPDCELLGAIKKAWSSTGWIHNWIEFRPLSESETARL